MRKPLPPPPPSAALVRPAAPPKVLAPPPGASRKPEKPAPAPRVAPAAPEAPAKPAAARPEDVFLCGNALDELRKLPDKSVDHTITDPPYDEHTHTKATRHAGKHKDGSYKGTSIENFGFGHISNEAIEIVAREIVRVTKGWALVFCADSQFMTWRRALEAAGAKWRRKCVWVKTNPMPKLHGDGPGQGDEVFVAVWCGSGRSEWNRGGRTNVWMYAKSSGGIHKTGKPLPLMVDLMLSFTKPGEVVLDAFAGGATTLIAAKRTGRRYIGFELDPEMHAAASELLSKEREQLRFFEDHHFTNDATMRGSAFGTEDAVDSSEQLGLDIGGAS